METDLIGAFYEHYGRAPNLQFGRMPKQQKTSG
jgi:hypothetical protein